jgi:predicted metal-dependent hydrolase
MQKTPDLRFTQGIDDFNCRQFFRCHEIWESLWRDQQAPEKDFTQGLIQIAVAYHHLLNGNYEGAGTLCAKGRAKLVKFSPIYANIDVKALIQDVEDTEKLLAENCHVSALITPTIKVVKQA